VAGGFTLLGEHMNRAERLPCRKVVTKDPGSVRINLYFGYKATHVLYSQLAIPPIVLYDRLPAMLRRAAGALVSAAPRIRTLD
jgi:hypothetical protein